MSTPAKSQHRRPQYATCRSQAPAKLIISAEEAEDISWTLLEASADFFRPHSSLHCALFQRLVGHIRSTHLPAPTTYMRGLTLDPYSGHPNFRAHGPPFAFLLHGAPQRPFLRTSVPSLTTNFAIDCPLLLTASISPLATKTIRPRASTTHSLPVLACLLFWYCLFFCFIFSGGR